MHCIHAKINRIRAHPGCLLKISEKDQHRESLDYHSDKLAVSIYECHEDNAVETFVVVTVVRPSLVYGTAV